MLGSSPGRIFKPTVVVIFGLLGLYFIAKGLGLTLPFELIPLAQSARIPAGIVLLLAGYGVVRFLGPHGSGDEP